MNEEEKNTSESIFDGLSTKKRRNLIIFFRISAIVVLLLGVYMAYKLADYRHGWEDALRYFSEKNPTVCTYHYRD